MEITIRLDAEHNFEQVLVDGRAASEGNAPCNLEELLFFALNSCENPVHIPYASKELEQRMEDGKKRAAKALLWLFSGCAKLSGGHQ